MNYVTASNMRSQVHNSGQQVTADRHNLTPTAACWEDTGRFLGLLAEVLPYGQAVHYLQPQPGSALSATYPGFAEPGEWWPLYERWATRSLDTLAGTLETVHYQLRPEQQFVEQELLTVLQEKTRAADGNLAVSQTGNMIELQIVEEQRKLRQMFGATLNAQNVASAYQITYQAAQERIEHDWLERSVTAIPVYNNGQGYGMFGATR